MKVIVSFLKNGVVYLMCVIYDVVKSFFLSNMIFKRQNNSEALGANIMINIHRVEKGLTLKKTRILFGKWFFPKLLLDIEKFRQKFGNVYPVNISQSSLSEYKQFHIDNNINQNQFPLNKISITNTELSGTKDYNTVHHENSYNDFHDFVLRRSSVRNFSNKANLSDIKKAVEIAMKTPSVCNRQPWGVYYFSEKQEVQSLLSYQNGNLGFREDIPGLVIITGNLKEMEFPFERHQIFIEGGLFSMSFIYALHSFGISSCCLNWCSKPWNDYKAHKVSGIPLDQEIIMFMAVGISEKDIRVTISPQKPISKVLHDSRNEQ